jgi:predicted XRE-type DNA-binding protein
MRHPLALAGGIGIGYNPVMPDLRNVRIRRRLIRMITAEIDARGLTQTAAARLLGTTQPRVSDLVRGKVDEFTIDALVNMLAAAGLPADVTPRVRGTRSGKSDSGSAAVRPHEVDPVVRAYVAGVDRSLIREALRRSPTERIEALSALQALAAEAAAAGRRAAVRRSSGPRSGMVRPPRGRPS